MKNKCSQSHKRGRKRPKYKAPCPWHPKTIQNFIRPHFTTKKVPAVAMGIIKEKLPCENIFMIQAAAAA